MTRFLLPAAAVVALALAACQGAAPPATAQAPADAMVATAVSDVRSAAIDPATGKHREAGAVFIAAADTTGMTAPLGSVTPGAPRSTLDLEPGTIIVQPAGN